jgi:hypothetical protein
LDDGRSNENIVEVERAREGRIASANHWKSGAVSHDDRGGKNRGVGGGDHTGMGGDVGRRAGIEHPIRGWWRWREGTVLKALARVEESHDDGGNGPWWNGPGAGGA